MWHRDGSGSATVSSRGLVDVSGTGKKEDAYVARSEKTSNLWRPGNGFRPTSFGSAKGPRVRPAYRINA